MHTARHHDKGRSVARDLSNGAQRRSEVYNAVTGHPKNSASRLLLFPQQEELAAERKGLCAVETGQRPQEDDSIISPG